MSRRPSPADIRHEIPSRDDNTLPEDEKLLRLYESLRAEIRLRIQTANRRVTRGIAVVGAVIGSVVVKDFVSLLAFVPFVIGFLFIDTVRNHNEVMTTAGHLAEIEQELSEQDSLFRYENKLGGAFGRTKGGGLHAGWVSVPNYIRAILFVIVYFVSIEVLLSHWPSNPPQLFGVQIQQDLLLVLLIGYTAILMLVGYSHLAYRTQLATDVFDL